MRARAIACVALVVMGCGPDVERAPEPPPPEATNGMGDGTMYCNGAVDCPADAECKVWWCQPVRDEPNPDDAWGVCKIDPVVDGEKCDGGACMSGRCEGRGR